MEVEEWEEEPWRGGPRRQTGEKFTQLSNGHKNLNVAPTFVNNPFLTFSRFSSRFSSDDGTGSSSAATSSVVSR